MWGIVSSADCCLHFGTGFFNKMAHFNKGVVNMGWVFWVVYVIEIAKDSKIV